MLLSWSDAVDSMATMNKSAVSYQAWVGLDQRRKRAEKGVEGLDGGIER